MNPIEGEPWLKCPTCGYDLRGLPENRCPECGEVFDPMLLRQRFEAKTRQSFSDLLFEYLGKAFLTTIFSSPFLMASIIAYKFDGVSIALVIVIFSGIAFVWLALLRGFLKRLRDVGGHRRVAFVALGIFVVVASSPFILNYFFP